MSEGIVSTIGQRCRRCYSCIRECPAKAIRVMNEQAVVIGERCISCGHCIKVCSQNAKKIQGNSFIVKELLKANNCVAVVAPSFAASFPENYNKIPTALRELGFNQVLETAFGADLVSREYKKYFESNNKTIISSPCPAIYNFIEKYHSELVPNIAPIISPMIAIGKWYKKYKDKSAKVIFIGPCVAKKSEYMDEEVKGAIDGVLTFKELKELFQERSINLNEFSDSEFDPPHAYLGKSYPLSGGLLKTSDIPNNFLEQEVIVVDGKTKVEEIIHDLCNNNSEKKFIDILFCEGCINGPAIDSELTYYSKRDKVINYVQEHCGSVDRTIWKSDLYNSREIDLTRKFEAKDQRIPSPNEEEIKSILAKTNKFSQKDELNCGACGYLTCREYAVAIAKGLAENDMCLPFLVDKLERAYSELKETQEQLHSAEKLAAIGQLAAGVAHEINNPLGTILLYSSMLKRELTHLPNSDQIGDDLDLITSEVNRCKHIVSNLLNFARQGKVHYSKISIEKLIPDVIHTFQINPRFSDVTFTFEDKTDGLSFNADLDQLKQVFINILGNAAEAVEQSVSKSIFISAGTEEQKILINIKDSGCGMSDDLKKKIFTPFFTTKKIGKGTGLGLAIAYGIVKMHRGEITVESKLNEGSNFKIKLPYNLINEGNTFRENYHVS